MKIHSEILSKIIENLIEKHKEYAPQSGQLWSRDSGMEQHMEINKCDPTHRQRLCGYLHLGRRGGGLAWSKTELDSHPEIGKSSNSSLLALSLHANDLCLPDLWGQTIAKLQVQLPLYRRFLELLFG